jgi:hypothetical protein
MTKSTKPHATKRAAKAVAQTPGSLAGIGGVIAGMAAFFPSQSTLLISLGAFVSALGPVAAAIHGVMQKRASGNGRPV